ncbi:MAG: CsbD family protein [Leptolyngbya sp. DLM2.Bin27]|nr:MAG: CsbD family protein [Leptolyngbya sp. DLM2.Bin27]
MTFTAIAARLQRLFCVGLATLVIGSGLLFGFGSPAVALGNEAGDIVQQRAEREFDRKAGAGTANQLEGRAQEELGKAQRQINQVTGGTEGIGNQVQGQVQKTVGRTQGAVEDAAESAQESAGGIVDSVKDFFGQ